MAEGASVCFVNITCYLAMSYVVVPPWVWGGGLY